VLLGCVETVTFIVNKLNVTGFLETVRFIVKSQIVTG
jgi:hypothetical protein